MIGKRNDDTITQKYIKEATYYNENDGMLYWREDRPTSHFSCTRLHTYYMNRFAGKMCGNWNARTDSKKAGFGYYVMRINNKTIKTHRMIFLYHHGYLPKIVDHLDTNTRNCKIGNLRDAGAKGNGLNQSKPRHNTTGYKGVSNNNAKHWKYKSSIMLDNRTYNIGSYNNLEEAAASYNIISKLLHGEFGKLNDTSFPEEKVTKVSKFWTDYYPELLEKFGNTTRTQQKE